MYVLVAYDIKDVEKRAKIHNKTHQICRKYLYPLQLSVFHGELDKTKYKNLIKELKNILNEDMDSLITITANNKNNLDFDIFGQSKQYSNIISSSTDA